MNKIWGGLKRLYQLPGPLKAAYAKSSLDYFFPRLNLIGILRRLVPKASASEIEDVVQTTFHDPVLCEIKRLRNCANGLLSDSELDFIYSLVLLTQPKTILETGVAAGGSTAAILSALSWNQKGTLISVDLPSVLVGSEIRTLSGRYRFQPGETSTVPDFDQVGWLIPKSLQDRWVLHVGDSLELMGNVLKNVDGLDLFLHDSFHSYTHMKTEFELAWPHLNSGGYLLADDIFVFGHTAIVDFSREVGRRFYSYSGLGIVVK